LPIRVPFCLRQSLAGLEGHWLRRQHVQEIVRHCRNFSQSKDRRSQCAFELPEFCTSLWSDLHFPQLPKLVSATRNTTIKEVLEMYKNNDIHRVYVVTAEFHKPLGVITLTDMLSIFATAA